MVSQGCPSLGVRERVVVGLGGLPAVTVLGTAHYQYPSIFRMHKQPLHITDCRSYRLKLHYIMIAIADREVTLFQTVVGSILILFSLANILIYVRLNKGYSVKYELLRDRNLRGRKWFQSFVKVLYFVELLIPVVLMLILFLEVVSRDVRAGFIALANGLLLLSLIYLTNSKVFYFKLLVMLVLTVVAELVTLYLSFEDPGELYSSSSSVFFSINGILVSLAILSRETAYWNVSMAVHSIKEQVLNVNEEWLVKSPKIVDGGLYGWFYDNKGSLNSIFLYGGSVAVLAIYAFQDWWFSGKFIGTISAAAILTFDFAILVLSSLSDKIRSPFSIMVIIFVIRFFLFAFGNTYWFMGYCVLYIIVGTFIAYLIVQKRFPKYKVQEVEADINALKTPEFIMILITTELVALIIALYFSKDTSFRADVFVINGQQFPLWSFGVVSIIITFVLSLYFASIRVLYRMVNHIRDKIVYYFGTETITQYHVFLSVTYILIVLLGVYTHLTYDAPLSLTLCFFLPLILNVILQIGVCWKQNNYYILGEIDQYNKKERRKQKIRDNNQKILSRAVNNQDILKQLGETQMEKWNRMENTKKQVNGHDLSANQLVQRHRPDEESEDGYQELADWRDPNNGIHFPQLLSHITPNDKRLLVFLAILIVLLVGLVATSYLWCQSPVGLHLFVSFVSYLLQVSYYRCTKTHHDLQVVQLIGIIAGYLLGMIYWSVLWDNPSGGLSWSIIFILILTYLLIETLRHTKDQKKLYVTQIIQILLLMVFEVVLVDLNFDQPYYVIIVCGVIFYFLLGLAFYYVYTIFKKALPRWVYFGFGSVVAATLLGVIIGTFFVNSLSVLGIVSIVILIPVGGFIAFGWLQFYLRYLNRFQTVVVYSAYGLPAYKFMSENETLKKDQMHLYLYFIALMGLVVYAQIVFFFFEGNINKGIFSLCFFQVVGFASFVLVSMKNYYNIGVAKNELTEAIVGDTFKLLIDKYMPDIDNDENTGLMRKHLKELQDQLQANPEAVNVHEKYDNIVFLHDKIVHNEEEEEMFLFFWIGLIEFRLLSEKKIMMNNLLNDILEIRVELQDAGIVFSEYDNNTDLQIRYEKQLSHIRSLEPLKQLIFQQVMREHKAKKVADDVRAKQMDQVERRQNLERDHALQKKMEQQMKQTLTKGSKFTDMDKAKVAQFTALVQSYKGLYIDSEFPPDGDSLGGRVANKVDRWERPSKKCKVVKGSIDSTDVKQGQVGNCYLISTFGVLGENNIKKAMGMAFVNSKGEDVPEKWPSDSEKGMYMVRFKKFERNIFIVIDDLFPVNTEGNWVCGRSEDPEQIWPNLLEKAYAKMYGSYSKIFGGKAHFVMAQFTGGFPSQILLEQYVHNVNALWKKLLQFRENKYMLAAGTPPGSDTSYSKLGIAKGHAYSILDVKAVESYKLIKLKNPQGSLSVEWKGDFSDDSPLMDNRMKGILKHQKGKDGIFWMPVLDFIRQYKSVYVCRKFGTDWIQFKSDNRWETGVNSYGNEKNRDIEKNPQYGITITQPSTLFVSLTQSRDQSSTSNVGIHRISFRLQKNNGKRLHFKDISSQLLCSPAANPTTNITLSNQYELQEGTYPCTYSLMVFTQDKDQDDSFHLELYCNDKKATIVDDQHFDR